MNLSLRLIGALSLVIALVVAQAGHAGAASGIVLTGHVTDASAATPRGAARVQVEVQAEDRGAGHATVVARGRTDARGDFALSVPGARAASSYRVVALYRGVTYGVAVSAANASRPVALKVYDTTGSDAGLIAPEVQIGARREGRNLIVIEQWSVTNPTTSTLVGRDAATGRQSATFPVPAGATNLRVRAAGPDGTAARVAHGAVLMDAIIRPATGMNASSFHQVSFTFSLPATPGSDHPTLLIPTRYVIGSLEVFAIGSKVVAPGFTKITIQSGQQSIPAYKATAIAANSTAAVGIDGPPVVATAPVQLPLSFPLGSVLILAGGGFLLLLMTALAGRGGGSISARERLALQRERARLVGLIAELDLRHARGVVAPDDYQRRRTREKGRLLDVALRLGER